MTTWTIMKRYLKSYGPLFLGFTICMVVLHEVFPSGPEKAPAPLPFALRLVVAVITVVVMGFAAAYVLMLHGRFVRRKIRNKEDAWKTHVERRVRVALAYEEAFEKTRRLLRSIRAGIVYENKERHTITGRTWRERLSVRFEELAHDETEAMVRSVPKHSPLLADQSIVTRKPNSWEWPQWEDSGKNALNVQRLCDGLVAAAATPVGENGPTCSVP